MKAQFGQLSILLATLGLGLATAPPPASAGIVVYEEEDGPKKVEVGGRIQVQYLSTDAIGEERRDEVFFRRLRPYILATVTENWIGMIQVDFGIAIEGDEVAIKDAYMQYSGWENLKLTIGNAKPFFGREFLASSKRQQTVERGFVGNHNFGTPDRALGFSLAGQNESRKITWGVSAGAEHHDPDARRLDLDTPVNRMEDWNQGLLVTARADFHPNGFMAFDQGDFHTDEIKYNFSVAAYSWSNDGDNNSYTDDDGMSLSDSRADVDSATGFELSAGLRGHGWSFDAEYHRISADTVVSDFTGGIYVGGSTDIDEFQIEGGYMLPNVKMEIVGRWETQDADGFENAWTATDVGLNYFFNKHKIKVQLTYRMGKNVLGVADSETNSFFMQWQFVF